MHNHPLDDLSVHRNPTNGAALNRAAAHFARLNHSDPVELLARHRDVPPDRLRCLRTALHKIEAYPERFGRPSDNYLPTVSVIGMSGWEYATAFCLCGIKNQYGYSQPCHQWAFCCACSYWKRKRAALDAYLTRFHRTSWFMVTISYNVALGDDILDDDEARFSRARGRSSFFSRA